MASTIPNESRRYLVTGAGRGMGRAIVKELHKKSYTVYALSKTLVNLESLKKECPNIIPVCVDLADWKATRQAVEQLEPVDCLINNAATVVPQTFLEIQPTDFDTQMNVNLKSVINVSQVVAQKMIGRGKGGSVVNISSIAGRMPFPSAAAYGCSKAALEHLTKAMASELGPFKIRVNTVCPAAVDTDIFAQFVDTDVKRREVLKLMESRSPTKAQFMPIQEVVTTVLFLGSDTTTQITGQSIAVDGGYTIS